jgi:hypothetical protein
MLWICDARFDADTIERGTPHAIRRDVAVLDRNPSYVDVMERVLASSHFGDADELSARDVTHLTVRRAAGGMLTDLQVQVIDRLSSQHVAT